MAAALWCLSYAAMALVEDPALAVFWYRLGSLGWASIPFLTALLAVRLSHSWSNTKSPWWETALILGPLGIFVAAGLSGKLLAQDFIKLPVSWLEIIPYSNLLDLPWLILAGASPIFALVQALRFHPHPLSNKQKLQMQYFIIPGIVAFVVSMISNLILPLIWPRLPAIGHLFTGFWFLSIGLALTKFTSMLKVSPEFAAESVVMNMSDILCLVDLRGTIVQTNPPIQNLLGLDPQSIEGLTLESLVADFTFQDAIGRLETSGEQFPVSLKSQTGELVPCSCLVRPIKDSFSDPAGYMVIFSDRRELQRLAMAAETDHLTGIYNRARISQAIQEELERYSRYHTDFAILLLDLDHFKVINDTHGHVVGDRVLIETCRRIRRVLRTSDVVGRWGGEEFVVLCPQTKRDEALIIAERIRQAMANELFTLGIRLTVSIGMAQVIPGDNLISVVNRADKAMYCSKHLGRNSVSEGCDLQ